MKRLVIIADHPFVVAAIRSALRQAAGFDLVGVLDGRRPTGGQVAPLAPDLLVVDDMERGDDTLKRLREVEHEVPSAMLVLLTARMEDDGWLEEAFDAGGHAAVSKDLHPVALGTLLRETVRRNVVHRYQRPCSERRAGPLTAREAEILGLLAQGHTNLRIARELWIAERTVKFHLSNTYRKLGVANRTEACRYAYLHDMASVATGV
jgi:DNA-binding NarL/FixJ family response regulator